MDKTLLAIVGATIIAILLTPKGRETTTGICAVALDTAGRKHKNKEKILALLVEQGELSNADIRVKIKAHRRSVRRYLDELEEEGKVEQIGDTGRGVVYRLR
jgi:predicted HTH transcriptional regulator